MPCLYHICSLAKIAQDETIRKLTAPIPEHELKQQRKLVQ